MPILDESHDFAHTVEGDSAWSESYYFNGYDPVTDAGLFTRIGVRPNEGSMDVGLSVWLPGREVAYVFEVRACQEMTDSDLTVGSVRYERVTPMKEWSLLADGEALVLDLDSEEGRSAHLALDLRFEALTPAIGIDAQGGERSGASASTASTVGKGHFEQAGRWIGWIEIDGDRRMLVSARGNRDKSWGPRRWGGPRMWRWFSINIGDDMHLGGIRIGTDAGDLHRGWVWRDGEAVSVRDWNVTTDLGDDGITHRALALVVTDKLGRSHELSGEVLRVAPIRTDRGGRVTLLNEGLTRWTFGGATGYGIAEYLHQLGPDGRPVVPIE